MLKAVVLLAVLAVAYGQGYTTVQSLFGNSIQTGGNPFTTTINAIARDQQFQNGGVGSAQNVGGCQIVNGYGNTNTAWYTGAGYLFQGVFSSWTSTGAAEVETGCLDGTIVWDGTTNAAPSTWAACSTSSGNNGLGWYSTYAWTWSTVGGKFIMVQTQTTCTAQQSAVCASLQNTPTSGAAWTWVAGCVAPSAAGLVGTWVSNVGTVVTIGAWSSNPACGFSITPNFWLPGAFPTTGTQAGLPAAIAPSSTCYGWLLKDANTFPKGSKNVSPFTRVAGNVTCGGSSYVFAIDVSSFNSGPSTQATSAYGTAFTLQLQLASTATFPLQTQPAVNTTATLTGPGSDFVGRVNGMPIYATDYLWAPNGNPCANPKQRLSGSTFGLCVNPSSTVQASAMAVVAAMVAVLALAF